ncbi:MAG TPA: aminotransferase class V-fold PLP-dependent enzyme [Steroidobacteraceae bacterium]|nr:aminotransferase class V-fold PLP-dependent enzyme [Steroidobacteraceae bacterium]
MESEFASLWGLDRSVLYLNHGSFGACPTAVLAAQTRLRTRMESEPVDFLSATLPAGLHTARSALAHFLGANEQDLAFAPNATTAVNAVLQSLAFERDDELLLTSHTYAACRKAVDWIAARSGVHVVVAQLPFPVRSEEEIVAAILTCVSPQTRLALLDHVTSPTALVMPLGRLVRELQDRDVDCLVDGAHAPGMVPIRLNELGAAYYTGNAHKWLCAPKGAAFLYARRDRQSALHPTVISHGYAAGFPEEFDWTGTFDPTPWLCIGESIHYLQGLLPGGWPELMARNHALALRARTILLQALNIEAPCPEEMIGSMASIPLPTPSDGSPAARLDFDGLHGWFRERGVETWLYPQPMLLVRLSAQLYNSVPQYERLATLLREAVYGR